MWENLGYACEDDYTNNPMPFLIDIEEQIEVVSDYLTSMGMAVTHAPLSSHKGKTLLAAIPILGSPITRKREQIEIRLGTLTKRSPKDGKTLIVVIVERGNK